MDHLRLVISKSSSTALSHCSCQDSRKKETSETRGGSLTSSDQMGYISALDQPLKYPNLKPIFALTKDNEEDK